LSVGPDSYRDVGKNQMCHLRFGFFTLTDNVLGIAEGGEIEAESFDFAPRRAKTNFF